MRKGVVTKECLLTNISDEILSCDKYVIYPNNTLSIDLSQIQFKPILDIFADKIRKKQLEFKLNGVKLTDIQVEELEYRGDGSGGPHKGTHVSGGSDEFVSTDILEAVVKRIRESFGPTNLDIGAIADGEFLKRSGNTIIGDGVTVPSVVVYVDKNRTDAYTEDGTLACPFKTIQAAVDSIADAGPAKRYVVKIAPGVYEENVVAKRFVHLVGETFGLGNNTLIRTSSGVALTIPPYDFSMMNVSCETGGATPEEAALRMVDDGLGPGWEVFAANVYLNSTTVARGFWNDMSGAMFIGVYLGIEGSPGGDSVYLDGGSSLAWILGGGSEVAETGVKLRNWSFLLALAGVGLGGGVTTGTEWSVDADASYVIIDGARMDAENGMKLANGATAMIANGSTFFGLGGVPVEADATCAIFLGDAQLDGVIGQALRTWNLDPATFLALIPNSREGHGTLAERPPVVPVLFKYFATDLFQWLTWTGAAWVDPTGAVVP